MKVIPLTVAPVTLLVSDKAPAPLTLKPVPTDTPPTADVVARGRSEAPRAAPVSYTHLTLPTKRIV